MRGFSFPIYPSFLYLFMDLLFELISYSFRCICMNGNKMCLIFNGIRIRNVVARNICKQFKKEITCIIEK